MQIGTIVLEGVYGVEEFEVVHAEILAWHQDNKIWLNLEVKSKKKRLGLSDFESSEIQISAETTILLDELIPSELVGKTFYVKNAIEEDIGDWFGVFCFFEQQDMNENVIVFTSKNENMFSVEWQGETGDLKQIGVESPKTRISIKAFFNFNNLNEWEND